MKGRGMKKVIGVLLLSSLVGEAVAETDYATLLEAVENYQNGYSDTKALQVIYEVARSEDYEEMVTRCMGIYTLHMGLSGNIGGCQGGFQAICDRYPSSQVARYLRQLDLFSSPCGTCQGIGVVQQTRVSECAVCGNAGRCTRCGGKGTIVTTLKNNGLKGPVRKGNWYDKHGWLVRHYGPEESDPKAVTIPCPACKSSGLCVSCKGAPRSERAVNVRCPVCNGVSKGINAAAARNGCVQLCSETQDMLQKTMECEGAYAEAMQADDPQKRLDALDACLTKYQGALNLAVVSSEREKLLQAGAEQTKLREQRAQDELARLARAQQDEQMRLTREQQEAQMRLTREQELATQKQQTSERHQSLLQAIRETKSKTAALSEIRQFLEGNPDSPLLVEARLLAAEVEEEVAAEAQKAKRKRIILTGCGSAAGMAVLALLAGMCLKRKSPVAVRVPTALGKKPEQRKIPFKPAAQSVAVEGARSQPRVVFSVTLGTPEANALPCPECGALVDCPPDIRDEIVICGECRKAFHVN